MIKKLYKKGKIIAYQCEALCDGCIETPTKKQIKM